MADSDAPDPQADVAPSGASFYISPRDRDMMIRTVAGETGNQPDIGKVAVAHVILNRVIAGDYGGGTPTAVVLAPHQFEPWQTRPGDLMALTPDSPVYQRSAAAVDAALSGAAPDPTGGATHFLNPATVRQRRGGSLPGWAQGDSTQIGAHTFYSPNGPVAPDALPANAAQTQPRGSTMPMPQRTSVATQSGPDLSDDALAAMLSGNTSQPSTQGSAPSLSAGSAATAPPPSPMYIEVHPRGASAPATAAAPASAQGGQGGVDLSDAALEAMLSGKTPAPMPAAPEGGSAVAIASRPPTSSAPAGDASAAVGRGIIDGVPIAGPWLTAGVDRGVAAIRSVQNDTKFSDELKRTQDFGQSTADQHPTATTAGNIGGTVLGLAPLAAAAPAAFGITGKGMVGRMLAGAMTGGAIGGADTTSRQIASGNGVDPQLIGIGAGAGALGGLVAPPIGNAVGNVVNKLLGAGSGGAASRNVINLLTEIGVTPQEAQATLSRMGPAATLADVDPALTTEAGALAARGGRSTSVLKNAMAARASDANGRVAETFDRTLGPKPDLTAELDASMSRGQAAASPYYDAARASRATVDVNPIISDIDQRLNMAAGGEAKVLNEVRSYLLTKDGLPKVGSDAVLKARQAIDDYAERLPQAETSAGRNARRTLTDLRGQVDDVLKANPDIAAGDAAYAGEARIRDAMQRGTELFQRSVRPEDFARQLASAAPGEADAIRSGARVAIGDALEQASRGELQGARTMFGSGSANRAKLRMLFPNADEALDALQTEAAMRATESRVAANSATAERLAAGARYSPAGAGGGLSNDLLAAAQGFALGDPSGGVATAIARRGAGGIMNKLTGQRYDTLASGTADRLAASGTDRDAFIRQLVAGKAAAPLAYAATAGTNLLVNAIGSTGRNRLMSNVPAPIGRH